MQAGVIGRSKAEIMSDVVVKPVVTRSDQRRFIGLPWSLYRDDKNWIPPLIRNQRELLGYKPHPFHENAEVQTFLAWKNGEVCGRIAAIINHEHNRVFKERRGFFGFFESTNDFGVTRALFDATLKWLAEREITQLRGPTNPSMNYECGLLIDGFDSPPTFMMTYNPPFYADLLQQYGFAKAHDLYAYIGDRTQLPQLETMLGPLVEQAQERCNAKIRPLSPSHFNRDVESFIDLYNRSLVHTWGFVPLPDKEMQKLAQSLRFLLIPDLALMAEVEGRPVGAVIGLPDYNPRIKKIKGRLFPFGFWTLLRRKDLIERVRVVSINVVPEFQRWGLGLVLMKHMLPCVLAGNMTEGEFSWVSEANTLARLGLEKAGTKHYKTYRIYDLDPSTRG